jgi:hypothetical protein
MAILKVAMPTKFQNAPPFLRSLPGWLVWKFEPNGKGKPRKVPYYVNGRRRQGVHGSPPDKSNLATFDTALARATAGGFDGIGLALLPEFNTVALDFDNCVENATVNKSVESIASDTYSEFSPSGKGVRCFFTGDLGNRKDSAHPDFGFETFSTKGFVTFTGDMLPITEITGNTEIVPVTPRVQDLYAERFGDRNIQADTTPNPPLGLTELQIDQCLTALPESLDYDQWLLTGMALHHEFSGSDHGFERWDTWSQASPKYTTREYNWERWASFGSHTGKPVTARSLVHLANEHGAGLALDGPASADEFDDVSTPEEPAADTPTKRFPVVDADAFTTGPHPGWIIKDVLPKAELAVLFGESGSGKSFAILDMVASVARGVPWRGHRVKQGRVVYIAAEGAGGFRKRLIAYAGRQGISLKGLNLGVMASTPNLLLKNDAFDVCKSIGKADVVVIDTLAQTTPGGNENAGEDMGKALAHCKGIHRSTGALVILVHHSGKDASKGARGWSGLRAACDAEFEVLRLAGGDRILRTSKQKDGDDGATWGFKLDVVDVGFDEDGDVVTSCVIKETEVTLAGATSRRALGVVEKIVAAAIDEVAAVQTEGIEIDAIIQMAREKLERGSGRQDTRPQRIKRALEALCGDENAPYIWDREDNTLSIV